jgi:hypothetical protein
VSVQRRRWNRSINRYYSAGRWPFVGMQTLTNSSYQAPSPAGKGKDLSAPGRRSSIPRAAWWLLGPQSCYPGTPTSASPRREEEAKTCSHKPLHLVFRWWLELGRHALRQHEANFLCFSGRASRVGGNGNTCEVCWHCEHMTPRRLDCSQGVEDYLREGAIFSSGLRYLYSGRSEFTHTFNSCLPWQARLRGGSLWKLCVDCSVLLHPCLHAWQSVDSRLLTW